MDNQIYKSYYSDHLKNVHKPAKDEYKEYCLYYKKNYRRFLGEDKNISILDIGCGTGQFLYFLKESGYKNCKGIDISEEEIGICKDLGFKNVEAISMQDYIEKTQDKYDIIIMNDVIEHITKTEAMKVLVDLKKIMADNGRIVIKTDNAANPIIGLASRYIDITHEVSYTQESLSQLLRFCGYRDIRIHRQKLYYRNGPLWLLAKLVAWILEGCFFLLFRMYGRKSTTIFTKMIFASAQK